jgi:hypothetical protein
VSFTGTFPTNIPKFSCIAGPTTVSSVDTAKGADSISTLSRQLYDSSLGVDTLSLKPFSFDVASGLEYSRIGLKRADTGSGAERIPLRSIKLYDSATSSDYILTRLIRLLDLATAVEAIIPSMHVSVGSASSDLATCLSELATVRNDVVTGKEIYARHYTIVPECTLKTLSLVGRLLQALKLRGVALPPDVQEKLVECWSKASSYPALQSGDIIEPEHENMLIDMVACLDSLYSVLRLILAVSILDKAGGLDYLRVLDLTPVAGQLTYVTSPIPYYTSQLSPPGGYVLTKPPVSYTTALVGSLWSTAWSLSLYVRNISKGWVVRWNDTNGNNPCAKVSVYSDGWVLAWIEDMCWGGADWDYNDMATGARTEILDGVTYIHAVFLDQDHLDTDQPCIDVEGSTYCGSGVGNYSGSVRVVWETWIRVS